MHETAQALDRSTWPRLARPLDRPRFEEFADQGSNVPFPDRPVVCVQGLGFVGAAMAVAVASALDDRGHPRFNVLGVERDGRHGERLTGSVNQGRFPFVTSDKKLSAAAAAATARGNLIATTDTAAYRLASVILIDINLDLDLDATPGSEGGHEAVDFTALRRAAATIGREMQPSALVIVESTVPPGTCEAVVAPVLEAELRARGLDQNRLLLAHSYERVMPGPDYLDSITDFWRVFAGHSTAAADACEAFLSQVVNVRDYPLRRLSSTTASETAKVLENSYRAVNIAMIDEWSRFAEAVDVDLFEVIAAIRQRPTHENLRLPGFGVGGYCLPKDPLMALSAARQLHGRPDLDFPFCRLAVEVNRAMPCASLAALEALLDGELAGKTLLMLGVSYRPGVADTRWSPSESFARAAIGRGARVRVHDPMVRDWPEFDISVERDLPPSDQVDGVVITVAHEDYVMLDLAAWVGERGLAIVDAANVLDRERRMRLRAQGSRVTSIGRGGVQ